MMNILGWILFGLIVGVIAKLLMPGRDPGGFVVTVALGIVGALVGGLHRPATRHVSGRSGAGYIMSTLGAIVVLFVYRAVARA